MFQIMIFPEHLKSGRQRGLLVVWQGGAQENNLLEKTLTSPDNRFAALRRGDF